MARVKGIVFSDLLANSADIDLGPLQEKKAQLVGRRTELQAELGRIQQELREAEGQLNALIPHAIKAAELLGTYRRSTCTSRARGPAAVVVLPAVGRQATVTARAPAGRQW